MYEDPDVQVVYLGNVRIRRARKTHRCHNCGHDILPGQVYRSQAMLVGGEFWMMKAHQGGCWIAHECTECGAPVPGSPDDQPSLCARCANEAALI